MADSTLHTWNLYWDSIDPVLLKQIADTEALKITKERELAASILAIVSSRAIVAKYPKASFYQPFENPAYNSRWIAKYDKDHEITNTIVSSCLKRNYDEVERNSAYCYLSHLMPFLMFACTQS